MAESLHSVMAQWIQYKLAQLGKAVFVKQSCTTLVSWSPLAEGKESDLREEDMERGLDPGLAVAMKT